MAISSLRPVFVVQAERLSGVDTLHYDFERPAAVIAGNNYIKHECKDLRDNSTYKLVTVRADVYPFDTAKSAYDRMVLKNRKDDNIIAVEELTFLMNAELVPGSSGTCGYEVAYKDKAPISMQAPYPVGDGDKCVLSVMEQVRADMARISFALAQQRVKLTAREQKHLSSNIRRYYEDREDGDPSATDSGAYQELIDTSSEKRKDIIRRYLANDEDFEVTGFMELASSIYLPFLDELMGNFDKLIVGRSHAEANNLITLMEFYQDYKKGQPFAGYELLPRKVRI